ncbi:serine/threonine-protein kinase [Pseudonocardia sp. DLS-67]
MPAPAIHDVGLTRLLAVARLTPAQAVALGTDLLAALEDPQTVPGADVRVGPDGRARVAGSHPTGTHGARLAAAAGLDQLRAATHRAPVPALDRALAEARAPDGRLAFAAAILREADAPDGARARAELSKLVALVAGDAPETVAPDTPPRRHRPGRTPRARTRALVTRSWKWVLSLVLLVAIVAVEIAFLQDRIVRDVQAVLDAGRSAAGETGTPTALPPVLPPGPAAAGTISRVDLRPVQPCAPGTGCALRTQVVVRPQAEEQTITWELRILDRCTGEAVTVPGGTVTVPPQGDRADAVGTVALPPAGALAVVAVTNLPATAASVPVNVPEPGACTN